MIGLLLVAGTVVAPAGPLPGADPSVLAGAAHAIDAGRLEQGRLMIAQAVRAGLKGPPVERLLADLAFTSRNYSEALSRYQSLYSQGLRESELCRRGAKSALELGRTPQSLPLADCAIAWPKADWKAWNTRGVLADLMHDWDMADRCYSRASALAPDEGEIVNNEGWSLLLRGDWADALPRFEKAAALKPGSKRISNNLELARAALAADLPARRDDESDSEWAARLNDAGVAAQMLGDNKRALAAFTRAVDASFVWYERASDNLEAMTGQ